MQAFGAYPNKIEIPFEKLGKNNLYLIYGVTGSGKTTILSLIADILKREKSYMTLLHCPFKQNLNCVCKNCKFSDFATFKINSGKKFKIERKKTASCVFYLKDLL